MAKRISRPKWRASWKGQLRFGFVSFSVEAVNARSSDQGDIHFHQLHAKCHRRIHYQKVCPVHGEVDGDEIVSGYEYARGKYVEIDADELEALRTEKERSLTIDGFVSPDEIDLLYLDGRMYYLVPSDEESAEAYTLLRTALDQAQRWGVGHIVMSGKDQIVAIRAHEGLLHMAMLNYRAELRDAGDFARPKSKPAPRKLKLARDLVKSWIERDFDFSEYEDRYRNRLAELIEAKVSGKEVVAVDDEEEPQVINLMDALRKSVAKTGGRKPAARKRPKTKKSRTTRTRRRA